MAISGGSSKTKRVARKRATTTGGTKRRVPSALSALVPEPPVPVVASTTAIVRTGSRSSNVGKTAKLNKSRSRDAQIPAFGFIDVCFCVDSTGSMSG